MYNYRFSSVAKAVAAAGLLSCSMAKAVPVYTEAATDFTNSSVSFGFLGQQFTFLDLANGAFSFAPVGVTTGAGAAVTSLGAPFYDPAQPTTFFDPIRGLGPLVFDGSYQYSSFVGAVIPFSISPGFLGLALTLGDGTHYGFAQFAGTYLVSYGFESDAGRGIDVGATIAPVPEPETYALMLAGLGALGVVARRRKKTPQAAETVPTIA